MRLNHLLKGKRIASGEENSLWSIGELGSDSYFTLLCIYALCILVGGALMSVSMSALGIFNLRMYALGGCRCSLTLF